MGRADILYHAPAIEVCPGHYDGVQRWRLEIDEGRADLRCMYCNRVAHDGMRGQLQMAPVAVELIDAGDGGDLIVRVRESHA
jgi:hypothetical protein